MARGRSPVGTGFGSTVEEAVVDGTPLTVAAVEGDPLGATPPWRSAKGLAAEAMTHPVNDAAARIAAAHRVSVVDTMGLPSAAGPVSPT